MSALDFIPLSEAKARLVIHSSITEYDNLVDDLIHASVEFVEKYTSYMLYEREITESFRNNERIFYFPVTLPTVENVTYQTNKLSSTVCLSSGSSVDITMTVGYADSNDAPRALKEACYRLIKYWFDQPEMASVQLPVDVQLTLNRFRRDSSI